MRKREEFASDMQYKKYLLAVEYVLHLKKLQDKGYLIFDEENDLIEGEFVIPEGDSFCAVATREEGCTQGLVCFSYGDDGIPWIEDTMKEIDTLFKSYKCVNPKDVHRVFIKRPKYIRGEDGTIQGTKSSSK